MPRAGRAHVREVSNIECTATESRPHANGNERAYSLSVSWSDGTATTLEVQQSAFADLRARLKSDCYQDRPAIVLPEVPAPGGFVFKRDDKRRKAVQEFCQQILRLPSAPEKARIIAEFFSGDSVQTNSLQSVVYADIVVDPLSSFGVNSTPSTDDPVQYAELDLSGARSRAVGPKEPSTESDTLYAEVVPQNSPAVLLISQSQPAANGGDGKRSVAASPSVDGHDGGTALYVNVQPSGTSRFYENMALSRKVADAGKKYCKVIQSYEPNTYHSQGLSVEAGDIVQVQFESGGRAYCLMCAKSPLGITRPLEGWVPVEYLAACKPDVVDIADSAVPVVRIADDNQPSSGAAASVKKTKQGDKEKTGLRFPMLKIRTKLSADEKNGRLNNDAKIADSTVPIARDADDGQPSSEAAGIEKTKQDTKNKTAHRSQQLKVKTKPDADDKTAQQNKKAVASDSHVLDLPDSDWTSPIPVMPDILSPSLTLPAGKVFEKLSAHIGSSSDGRSSPPTACVRVIAIADFKAPTEGFACSQSVMSFTQGDVGELTYASQNQWWCVRREQIHGWVPADYWRVLSDDGRIGSGDTAPWMVGVMGREACEQMLMERGKQRNYVIRESKNLAGQYALSIKYNNRLHHFPIAPTDDGKFYIGKHNFSTIENVIIYYTKNMLFLDEASGQSVTLGKPLRMTS